ncbi:MAG: hypothetical protein K8U57_19520 [Planctomycetes bacterium]|nr:hypothetical protein [Planctomycetota bacterium]
MRTRSLLALLLIGTTLSGCVPTRQVPTVEVERVSTQEKAAPSQELLSAAQRGPRLYDTDEHVLNKTLREFAATPGTTPDPDFAQLELKGNEVWFATIPKGWQMQSGLLDGRQIDNGQIDKGQDPSGNVFISITYSDGARDLAAQGQNKIREVEVKKGDGKASTLFSERRYFRTPNGWACVALHLSPIRDRDFTLIDMLVYLQKYYGKYEGVCQRVRELHKLD